jgi:putative ABC transport system permease protein
MRALDRKLFRDLWGMRGQALAIALVIGSGVATYLMSKTVLTCLLVSQAQFYRDYRFAEIFASLKRAPESLKGRIEEIHGVVSVETRVIAGANLDIEGFTDPVTAQIVSVPDHGKPLLNDLYLKTGRYVDPGRDNEVIVSEAFATAQKLQPGSKIHATINGRRKGLTIVGIAVTPEYIYQLAPGSIIPDFTTYGILWMARTPLATAFDMDGAFNNVVMRASRGASTEDIIDRLDEVLERYGGLGAYSRKDQLSHRYLSEEFKQLEKMATMFPFIFLSVAAFLLNVAVSRLMAMQREQIGILKAFGYANHSILFHFLKLVTLIVVVGVAVGTALGAWLGYNLSQMYMEFYRFPYLVFEVTPAMVLSAFAIAMFAAGAGTVHAVYKAAALPPAQAMQPAPPAKYRHSIVERIGFNRLAQPTRMIIRNIERRPVKAMFSVIGVAFACAIVIMGGFFDDAVHYMVDIQFKIAQLDDISVAFVEAASRSAMFSLAAMDGVTYVEPYRSVPARFRNGYRTYRAGIQGIPSDGHLRRLLNTRLEVVALPQEGILLTDHLAKILDLRPGDLLTVEVLEGSRPVRQIPVAGVVQEYIGVSGYMNIDALNRFMREGPAISGVYMTAEKNKMERIYAELKQMPRVAGAAVREKALQNFYETMAKQALTFAFFNTLLAATIAFGVVYNTARVALSERNRELASLRVLGFTRGEIAYILLGELGLLVLAGLPFGCFIGKVFCAYFNASLQTDLFRVPLIINPDTYAFAATVVLVSTLISGVIVRRKLNQLDLVAVLKTKE